MLSLKQRRCTSRHAYPPHDVQRNDILCLTIRMSILDITEQMRTGRISPVELTKECLAHTGRNNSALNAFITVTAESALAQAYQAETAIQRGEWRGPLHGIPLALKDLIDTAGVLTTAASAVFKERIPAEDAEVTRRLKQAGAILLGKQNLHEFAYGGSSLVSYFGDVHNAWNPEHIAGGSSGGSATAVAAGMCYGAIGTDTAGSIREPASLCGVVGLKPTFGAVSTRGVIPLSQSLDHVGTIARTVEDAAIIFQAIAKETDVVQGWGSASPVRIEDPPAHKLRIAVPRKFFCEELDPEVASAFEQALSVLSTMSDISEINLEVPIDRTLQKAESYAYHCEFVRQSPELYQPETLRRIRTGEGISPEDAAQCKRELQEARKQIASVFNDVDLLITPTTPTPAPVISELKANPDLLRPRELALLRNTRPMNVWGLPAISVPCGFTQSGLPIGLQIIGPHGGESEVLQLAHAYEQATAWHQHLPNL
ncbi:MAG: Asp-tRNA(Asn)/Glu-tRNA(Gln) amidotransferase GatCAB subunit A [Acidobacteria bacterium]|nr:MAG: Asp-tRNA(Asn)/Glu-tRNA(Gln) amidotransferase GatCAB subunit A [Acidobacteriota bacterium]